MARTVADPVCEPDADEIAGGLLGKSDFDLGHCIDLSCRGGLCHDLQIYLAACWVAISDHAPDPDR